MIIPSLSGITTVLTDKAPLSLPVSYKYNTNGVVTMTTILYNRRSFTVWESTRLLTVCLLACLFIPTLHLQILSVRFINPNTCYTHTHRRMHAYTLLHRTALRCLGKHPQLDPLM